jgi:hypothetical protein
MLCNLINLPLGLFPVRRACLFSGAEALRALKAALLELPREISEEPLIGINLS